MASSDKKKNVTQKMIYRSVASSTAIETGEAVREIERKLKNKKSRFSHVQLAS